MALVVGGVNQSTGQTPGALLASARRELLEGCVAQTVSCPIVQPAPAQGPALAVPGRQYWQQAVVRDLEEEPSPWKKGRVNRWQRRHTVQTRRWSKALKKALLLRFR